MARKPGRRLDERLVADGLADDLRQARGLIMAGKVVVGEQLQTKAGLRVPDATGVRLKGVKKRWASRAGTKLEGALADLQLDVSGLSCLDVGASTGGFTDCLLGHGAAGVCAVDVGYGLLADKVRRDPRVVVMERCNARHLTAAALPWPPDLITIDVSFIGASALLPALTALAPASGRMLAMVKPQFELGRSDVGEGGVVRSDEARMRAVDNFSDAAQQLGWSEQGRCDSQLAGPKGNREVFVLLGR